MPLIKLADVAEVPAGTGREVRVAGKVLALFNLDGVFYALANECTHMGGPLGKGAVNGTTVTCPWHGSRFDVRTGQVVEPPARRPVVTYPVQVRDGAVYADLP
ncbi:MAG TPA: non-heme iron oxygenase ferredoxin subunit [bacterium]|nr:non-heme iron oxygenase ferredoxin subunit [bacterium]